jgi:hypothetical protein
VEIVAIILKLGLAVFAIVIAVGFVAANIIIPQASAQQFCVGKNGEVHNGGCPPGLNAATPGHNGAAPAKSSAPRQISGPGNAASQDAPGHLK